MRRSRALFKYSLRYCKRLEETTKADNQLKNLMISGNLSIKLTITTHHYQVLLAVQPAQRIYVGVLNNLPSDYICVTPRDVTQSIQGMQSGKSPGPDGLTSEH